MVDPDVSRMLEDGETVEREVTIGTNRVAVTDKRVLAFTPDAPGANFRKMDRPNVDDARVGVDSKRNHLINAGGMVFLAAVCIGGSRVVNFDGMFSDLDVGTGANAMGMGWVVDLIRLVGTLFALIDDVLFWGGILSLVLVPVFFGLYLWSRTTVVRLSVAGRNDVEFPAGEAPDVDDAVRELRVALGIESPAGAPADPGTTPTASAAATGSVEGGTGDATTDDGTGESDEELEYGT